MRLNIEKLQSGGLLFSAVANPFSLDTEFAQQEAAASSGSSEGGSSKLPEILSKETMNALMKTGLTNEFNQFASALSEMEKQLDMTGKIDRDELAVIRSMANRILQNKDYLDKAIESATSHEALDDVAIDQNGFIYAMNDKGHVEKIAFNKYNFKKHRALSVSELIEFRRNNPGAVDDSSMIADIGNSIGLEKINTFVQDILSKVGSSENKTEAYQNLSQLLTTGSKKMTQEDYDALKALAAASDQIGLDAIFKTSELNKNKNVAIACNYIMQILPKNMQQQLKASFIAKGESPKDAGRFAAQLISTAALADNDSVHHFSLDYNSDVNVAAGTKSTTAPKTRNISALEELTMGSMNKVQIEFRDNKDPNSSLVLHGTGKGYLPDAKGNVIPKGIATLAIQKSIGPLIDQNQIYIGDQKVSASTLDSVVYNGHEIANIWAPVDSQGNLDLSGLYQFQQIERELAKHPELSVQDKNQYLAEMGIRGYYDEQGEFHGGNNMAKFFVFTGITSDEVIDPKTAKLVDIIPDKFKDDEMKQIDGIYASANKAYGDGKDIFEFKKGFFSTDLITAPIFMKISRTAYDDAATMTGNGSMVTTPDYASSIARDNMDYQAEQNGPVYQPSTAFIFNE